MKREKFLPISYQDFDDLQGVNRFTSWYETAPLLWALLSIGWLWVIASFAVSFEFPSSGAVLICCAVLGEVYFERIHYRKWPMAAAGERKFAELTRQKDRAVTLNTESIFIMGDIMRGGHYRGLLSISRSNEWSESAIFDRRERKGLFWNYPSTIKRVENVATYTVVISVVVGTFIWGYGHCLYSACKFG
jgi:hypothetical protein